MKHRDKILELRKQGKSYKEIKNILNCSLGTISYHLGEGQKEKSNKRSKISKINEHPYVRKLMHYFDNRPHFKNKRKIPVSTIMRRLRFKLERFFRQRYNKSMGTTSKYNSPTFTVEEIINKFGETPTCYLTGRTIDIYNTKSYHFDHIIPVSRGGQNTLDNMGICIREANLAKHNMTPNELVDLCREIINYQDNKRDIPESNRLEFLRDRETT